MQGMDVRNWETFLRGQGYYWLEVDGVYDEPTVAATKEFQGENSLTADGVIGIKTFALAQKRFNFNPLDDAYEGEDGPNWPPRPEFLPLVGNDARGAIFGSFRYEPAPVSGNPEAIKILGDWEAKNIVVVEIPQLEGLKGTGKATKFQFHRLAAKQIQDFFQAVEDEGHMDMLLSWGGSYVPRFIRGSRGSLSNHSFGSAFDINVPWNALGVMPALKGKMGSVHELVPIAYRFGLYWGGHFHRNDGMHFEIAKILS
jgi:hypothetical protein